MATSFNDGMLQLSLTEQLKKILEQYTGDSQMLKELIQNAEDAGAKQIKFLYDKSHYGTDTLFHERLRKYQGPALYAYNDAEFSSKDWEGIRMIEDSVKKDDPFRVGRFGLGFKSVFHMTDFVGILSGNQVGFLDPHQEFFKKKSSDLELPTTSFAWKLGSEEWKHLNDQYAPFKQTVFGYPDESWSNSSSPHVHGTVFRFPLRSNPKSSLISKEIYSDDKMRKLFESFKKEAHLNLLFLTNVEKIEFYIKEHISSEPELLYSVAVDPKDIPKVRQGRTEFRERIVKANARWMIEPFHVTLCFDTILSDPNYENIVNSWLITHYCEGGENGSLNQLMEEESKKIPWVGICFSLNSEDKDGNEKPTGHLFCFLPLPRDESRSESESSTGFRFHIHGYFSMEQNRRHMKWDAENDECLWNRGLVEQALPHALQVTVRYCITHHPQFTYHLFPCTLGLPVPWTHLAQAFYETIRAENIFRTRHGEWVDYKEARILAHDEVYNDTILKVLTCASDIKCNLVEPPAHVLQAVEPCVPRQVSPEFLAQYLRAIELEHHFNEKERRQMIDYFSRKNEDLKFLLGIPILEKHEGVLGSLDEDMYVDATDIGTGLITLCPGLREILHSTLSQQDPHNAVLRRITNSGVSGIRLKIVESRDVPVVLKEMFRGIEAPVLLDQQYSCCVGTFTLDTTWHQKVWQHIERHINHVPLADYSGIPLLKSGERLYSLATDCPFISRGFEHLSLPDQIAEVAQQLGCVIVDDTSHVAHHYVAPPDPHGLLRAIGKLANSVDRIQKLDGVSKRALRIFLASTNYTCTQETELLSTLPLFETLPVMSNHEPIWVSASDVNFGTDLSAKIPVPLPDNVEIVDLSQNRDKDMALNLNVHCRDVTELFVDCVLPSFDSYNRGEKVRIVETIMSDFEQHRKNPKFEVILGKIYFVPVLDGSFKMVRKVFDPSDVTLQSLFGRFNILAYPDQPFQTDIMIARFKQIGLRDSRSITATEIKALAKCVDQQVGIAADDGFQLARAFVNFLSQNDQLLQDSAGFLRDLRVIPVLRERPDSYSMAVPWKGEQQAVVTPAMASTKRLLIGSQLCVPEVCYKSLVQTYGWDLNPSLIDVIQHLKCVIESHRIKDPASDMLFEIYRFLNGTVSQTNIDQVNALGNWIWCGNGYAHPSEVVYDLRSDASPYYYKCPPELDNYRDLLKLAGVRDRVGYTDILSKIKEAHDNGCAMLRTTGNHNKECLECCRDLKIVLDLVLHVKDLVDKARDSGDSGELLTGLFLPVYTANHTLRLAPLPACTYYDCGSDVRHEDIKDIEEQGFYILHEVISDKTAEPLGIPNFMSKYLDADEISYGQSESLTNRIRGLLTEYKDGLAVLKELIQNADDAGATKVAFIYDGRDFRNEDMDLPDENMRSMLGPAIWSYNDSVFTDQDFTNIVNLGGATKEHESTKIGKFGLGFNAVYHLTDVPSFASRDNIVFLDPRLKNLAKCIRDASKPGIKLNLQKRVNRIQRFKDMFLPYNRLFGWDRGKTFDGTLFRFPLRLESDHDGNKVCEKVYSQNEVEELFRIMQESAHTLLLFTQSVASVSVYTIGGNDLTQTELTESFSIHRRVSSVLRSMTPTPNDDVELEAECKVLHLAKRPRPRESDQPCANGYILNMSVQIAAGSLSNNTWWLVYNAVGSPFTEQQTSSTKGSLPVGGLATKLKKHGDSDKFKIAPLEKEEGKFFCFLPLPMENSFPVHVNGYFAIMSNRTHLHEATKTDKDTEKANWNKHLFEDSICKAYVMMLSDITQEKAMFIDQPDLQKNIYDLFPVSSNRPGCALTRAFLKTVFSESGTRLLPSGNTWIDNANFRALARDAYDSPEKDLFTRVCRQVLNRGDESDVFTELPRVLYDTLNAFELEKYCGENFMTIETLYKTVFLPNISHLCTSDILILLRFGVRFFAEKASDIFNKFECIPVHGGTMGEQQFIYPHRTVDPGSCLKDLFDTKDGYFPLPLLDRAMSKVDHERWISDLQKLGMRQKLLEPHEMLERANSILSLKRTPAVRRCRSLLALVERTSQEIIDTIKPEFITVPFFPSLRKPKEWMLPWLEDQQRLLACKELSDVIDYSYLGSVLTVPEYLPEISSAFKKLSLNPRLQAQTVVDQIKCIESYAQSNYLDVRNKNEVYTIGQIIHKCYQWLEYELNTEENSDTEVNIRGYDQPFVWVSNHARLVPAQICSRRNIRTYDCTPYLFHVPDFFGKYPKLAESLAIKNQMEPRDLRGALHCCAEEFGKDEVPENRQHAIFNLTQALACTMRDENRDTESVTEVHGPIYLLSQEDRFTVSTCLSVNTCDWMPDADLSHMCHPGISLADAKVLGVKPLQLAMLEDYMEGVNFGQTEKLTNRINRILESYPCDREILKELLQNADDAGASEIHFVLDERSFPSKRIFCDTWEHLQGPALLLFNDKPFTERDIKGIQELGEGSKGDDLIKTGKYGVGFNCVYHLTDTPTFYSRGVEIKERLCVFDPQCRYCPGAFKQHPGRMFKVDASLKNRFSDVFRCYDFPEFEQDEYTLFRIPLRSKVVSQTSVFSKKEVRCEDILELFDKFKQDMASTLIFLSHVRKISLSRIGEDDQLELIHSINSTITSGEHSKTAYDMAICEAANNLKRKPVETRVPIQNIDLTECVYELTISSSENVDEKWLVSLRLGFPSPGAVYEHIRKTYRENDATLLPRGGVAYIMSSTEKPNLPVTGIGENKDKNDSEDETDFMEKIMYDHLQSRRRNGKLFCSLPLPQSSFFPVHVNGHFVLDSETRHDICHSMDRYTFRSQWNQLLLDAVIAPAYVRLLEAIKDTIPSHPVLYEEIESQMDCFIEALPHLSLLEVRQLLHPLQISLLRYLLPRKTLIPVLEREHLSKTSHVFPKGEVVVAKWKSLDKEHDPVYFSRFDETADPSFNESMIRNVLLNCKFPITHLPCQIKTRIDEALEWEVNVELSWGKYHQRIEGNNENEKDNAQSLNQDSTREEYKQSSNDEDTNECDDMRSPNKESAEGSDVVQASTEQDTKVSDVIKSLNEEYTRSTDVIGSPSKEGARGDDDVQYLSQEGTIEGDRKSSNEEGLDDRKSSNEDDLDDRKSSNEDGLDDRKSSNEDDPGDRKSSNEDGLDDRKSSNEDGLDDRKSSNEDDLDDRKSSNEDDLDDRKSSNEDDPGDRKSSNEDGLDDRKSSNEDGLDDRKSSNEDGLDDRKSSNSDAPDTDDDSKDESNDEKTEVLTTVHITTKVVTPEAVLWHLKKNKTKQALFSLPSHVQKSPFISCEAVCDTFQYVSQRGNISKAPLLVTEDLMLREFDSENSPVLASSFSNLVPEIPEAFLNTIYFGGEEWRCELLEEDFSPFIKQMSVSDLAVLNFDFKSKVNKCGSDLPLRKKMWPQIVMLYKFLLQCAFLPESGPDKRVFHPEVLFPLNKWCIVPSLINKKVYLTKLETACNLFDTCYPSLLALDKLPLARILVPPKDIDPDNCVKEVLSHLIVQTDHPYRLLKALAQELHGCDNIAHCLQNKDADALLSYFSGEIESLKSELNARELLRQLPLFRKLDGNLVCLTDFEQVNILPPQIKRNGLYVLDDLQHGDPGNYYLFGSNKKTLFLSSHYDLEALYKFIGCIFPTFDEVYVRYILPRIHLMLPKERDNHILSIKQLLEEMNYGTESEKQENERIKQTLYNKLETIKFMTKPDGNLYATSTFYDPHNEVFAEMLDTCDFPPHPYNSYAWLDFLKRIGLVHEVTNDMYIHYAHKIARLPDRQVGLNKAYFLLGCIYSRRSGNKRCFLEELSGVAFVPRKQIGAYLTEVCPPYKKKSGHKEPLVALGKCIDSDYENVTWTVFPVLEYWAIPPTNVLNNCPSMIVQEPKASDIYRHINNIGVFWKWTLESNTDSSLICDVQDLLVEALRFLDKSNSTEKVKTTRCIVSDKGHFYTPEQIVRGLEKEWHGLIPDVCIIPDAYVQVVNFMKRIGTTEEITMKQAVAILKDLHDASKGKTLNPNEHKTALLATKLFFVLLEEQGAFIGNELYFLSEKGTIMHSNELCFVDDPSLSRRNIQTDMTSLHPLDKGKVGRTIHLQIMLKLIPKLPPKLQPVLLSSFMQEKMDESCCYDTGEEVETVLYLQDVLYSPEFHHSILRLIKNNISASATDEENDELRIEIEDQFNIISCVGLKAISTYLVQKGKRVPGSEQSKPFFMERSQESNKLTVYLTHEIIRNSVSVKIAQEILRNSSLFRDSPDVQQYLSTLLTTEKSKMNILLDELGFARFGEAHGENVGLPDLGRYLSQEYIAMLDPSLAPPEIGDFVALEVDDPMLEEIDRDGDPTYIFAKVVRVDKDEKDQYSCVLDVGDSKNRVVSSLEVYRFRNHELENEEETHDDDTSEDGEEIDTIGTAEAYIKDQLQLYAQSRDSQAMSQTYKRLVIQFHPDTNLQRPTFARHCYSFLEHQFDQFTTTKSSEPGRAQDYVRKPHADTISRRISKIRRSQTEVQTLGSDFLREYWRRIEFMPNPQPGLARRWMKQAKYDLDAVANDRNNPRLGVPYEWACFKCYQAVEKAKKAVQFFKDASVTHPQWCHLVEADCSELCDQLRDKLGHSDRMQYPDTHSRTTIPRIRYSEEKMDDAYALAKEIIKKCEVYIGGAQTSSSTYSARNVPVLGAKATSTELSRYRPTIIARRKKDIHQKTPGHQTTGCLETTTVSRPEESDTATERRTENRKEAPLASGLAQDQNGVAKLTECAVVSSSSDDDL